MSTSATVPKKPRAALGRAKAPGRRKRNRAGRPTADELERRKLKVMDVATDMFVARGYAATTLLDIAKKAGVATRTLYQHFGDKEDIFREVIFARDTAIINPPVLEEGEDLLTALRKAALYAYDIALRPRSIELMRLMIAESARFPELMSKVATIIFTRFTENVARLFRQLAEQGLIPKGDHDQSAELFVDLLLGNRTVMIYFGWISAAPTEKDTEVKLDLFINGRFGAVSAAKSGASTRKPAAKRAKTSAPEAVTPAPAKAAKPPAKPAKTVAKPAKPAAKRMEPATKVAKAAARTVEPAVKSKEPTAKPTAKTAKAAKPVSKRTA